MKAQPRMRRAALVLSGIAAALAVAALLSGAGPRLLPGALLAAFLSLLLLAPRRRSAPSPTERTYTERRTQRRRTVRPPRLRAERLAPHRPVPPPPAAPGP